MTPHRVSKHLSHWFRYFVCVNKRTPNRPRIHGHFFYGVCVVWNTEVHVYRPRCHRRTTGPSTGHYWEGSGSGTPDVTCVYGRCRPNLTHPSLPSTNTGETYDAGPLKVAPEPDVQPRRRKWGPWTLQQ